MVLLFSCLVVWLFSCFVVWLFVMLIHSTKPQNNKTTKQHLQTLILFKAVFASFVRRKRHHFAIA